MNYEERIAWVATLPAGEFSRLYEALEDHWPDARGRPEDVIAYNAFHAGWKAAKEDNDG